MKKISCLLFVWIVACSSVFAQELRESVFALTDKQCYLAGEKLCVRVDVFLDDKIPSLSKVAYVEIADTRQMYTQAMVALDNGQGWAEIQLPAKMHSGCYQLTAYTRALRNFGKEAFFKMNVGVINGEQLSRRDNIRFLPYERYVSGKTVDTTLGLSNTYLAGSEVVVSLPDCSAEGCAVTVESAGVISPLTIGTPSMVESDNGTQQFVPELEGHVICAEIQSDIAGEVFSTRLALIGQNASLFDGKVQKDGSFQYYAPGVYGSHPTLINAFDVEGRAIPIRLTTPYAKVLPNSLPQLLVYCQEPELLARATAARRQMAVNGWEHDTLKHSTGFMKSEPIRFYDLDEYANMSTIREVLLEFVQGVSRRKVNGMNMLYTIEPEGHRFSKWPALVLLDGMPVYDVDEIMDYDAHLIKYVQVYTDKFFFGNSCCQGVVSFVTRKGRLSNYRLSSAQQLAIYEFPQDHPRYSIETGECHGTILWEPKVNSRKLSFLAPAEPGMYSVTVQGLDQEGTPFRKSAEFLVPKL